MKTPTRNIQIEIDDNEGETELQEEDSASPKSVTSRNSKHSNASSKDSGQLASEDSDEDSENNDEDTADKVDKLEQKAREDADGIRDFALKHGFSVAGDAKADKAEELYRRAANFKVTKALLDEQEKRDQKRFLERVYVPPPLELLRKKYTNKEPVLTGFNQGLLPLELKNNFEAKRTPQGPHIVIKT